MCVVRSEYNASNAQHIACVCINRACLQVMCRNLQCSTFIVRIASSSGGAVCCAETINIQFSSCRAKKLCLFVNHHGLYSHTNPAQIFYTGVCVRVYARVCIFQIGKFHIGIYL